MEDRKERSKDKQEWKERESQRREKRERGKDKQEWKESDSKGI